MKAFNGREKLNTMLQHIQKELNVWKSKIDACLTPEERSCVNPDITSNPLKPRTPVDGRIKYATLLML